MCVCVCVSEMDGGEDNRYKNTHMCIDVALYMCLYCLIYVSVLPYICQYMDTYASCHRYRPKHIHLSHKTK
jgi:hypothetical protein